MASSILLQNKLIYYAINSRLLQGVFCPAQNIFSNVSVFCRKIAPPKIYGDKRAKIMYNKTVVSSIRRVFSLDLCIFIHSSSETALPKQMISRKRSSGGAEFIAHRCGFFILNGRKEDLTMTKFTKRTAAVLTASLMLAGVISGCGNNANNAPPLPAATMREPRFIRL